MKRLNILFQCFMIILIFISCNKSSSIEGLIPEYKSIILTQPIIIPNSGLYTLNEINTSCSINFAVLRYKFSANSGTFSSGDSLIWIKVDPNNTKILTSIRNNNVAAYQSGDFIDEVTFKTNNSNNNQLAAFTSKPPYTLITTITSNSFLPATGLEYKLNQDSFLGFKYSNNSNGKIYYGWIMMQVSNYGIIIKGYAYQTFEPIKAGG